MVKKKIQIKKNKLASRKKEYLNKKKNTKEGEYEESDDIYLEVDHVEFGEVAECPPRLSVKPVSKNPIQKKPKQTSKDDTRALELYQQNIRESYKQSKIRKQQSLQLLPPQKREKFSLEKF